MLPDVQAHGVAKAHEPKQKRTNEAMTDPTGERRSIRPSQGPGILSSARSGETTGLDLCRLRGRDLFRRDQRERQNRAYAGPVQSGGCRAGKLAEIGITESDVADAVKWARRGE